MLKEYILELEVGMSFNMLNVLANDVEVVVGSIYNNPSNTEPIKLEITEFKENDYHLKVSYNNVLIQYFFDKYEFQKVGD